MKEQSGKILELKGLGVTLTTRRLKFKVVDGVSFAIEASRTLGLVGESGSGKSMTALAILGLPLSGVQVSVGGSIKLAGRELNRISPEDLRQMRGKVASIIFQDPMSCLNPVMCVGRQTAEAVRRNHRLNPKQTRRKVLELFEEVGLPDPEHKYHAYPHELSGGAAAAHHDHHRPGR